MLILGEIKGYQSGGSRLFESKAAKLNVEQDAIRDLFARKQALLMELNNYQGNTRTKEQPDVDTVGAIPAKTRLQTAVDVNPGWWLVNRK